MPIVLMSSRLEQFGIILSLISVIVPLAGQLFGFKNTDSLVLMGILYMLSIGYYSVGPLVDKFKTIDALSLRVGDVEKKVDCAERLAVLETRMGFLETKKGQVDPRVVIIILMLIVLFLYLRSIGLLRI